MRSPNVNIIVADENYAIPPGFITSFSLSASISEAYPVGQFEIDDPEGLFLEKMIIKPGNRLIVNMEEKQTERSSSLKEKNFGLYVVTGVSGDPADSLSPDNIVPNITSSLGGKVVVQFAHPWSIFSDYDSHAYKDQIGKIVSQIVRSTKRGFSFAGTYIASETDDKGIITRFKTNESEASFIVNKLLPYVTIDRQPVYSFVNEIGEFYLTNFQRLYALDPLAILLPEAADITPNIYDIVQDKQKVALNYLSGSWVLGKDFADHFAYFKRWAVIHSAKDATTFRALMPYKPSIQNGNMLIKADVIRNTEATSAEVVTHRDFLDGTNSLVNASKKLDKFFTATVITPFSADVASVGYTVDWRLPSPSDPLKRHWLSGKWLVIESETIMRDKDQFFSRLTLARPAVRVTSSETTPDTINLQSLYNPDRDL